MKKSRDSASWDLRSWSRPQEWQLSASNLRWLQVVSSPFPVSKKQSKLNKNHLDLDLYSRLARSSDLSRSGSLVRVEKRAKYKKNQRLFDQNRHRVNRSIDQMWKLYFSGSCAKWLTVVSFVCFFYWCFFRFLVPFVIVMAIDAIAIISMKSIDVD